MDLLIHDLRDATRSLLKARGFTLTALLALALGVGAITTIFALVDAVLLRSLPYPDPERLVVLWGNVQRTAIERRGASYPDFRDWRDSSRSFEAMAGSSGATFSLLGAGDPEPVQAEVVSPSYFGLLGASPIAGSLFPDGAGDDRPGAPVVVLSHHLWTERFGRDPNIVGQTVQLDAQHYVVMGVLAAGFRGLTDVADLWMPASSDPSSVRDLDNRGNRGFPAVARLKAGVSAAQAQSELATIAEGIARAHPTTNEGRSVEVASLTDETIGNFRLPLLVLMGAVGVVLLMICTNLATLQLARAESRQREVAIRTALGASQRRLLGQLVTESLVLSAMGAALGALVALWMIELIVRTSPLLLPSFASPTIDTRIVLFVTLLTLVVGVALGLVPGAQGSSEQLHASLKESSKRTAGSARGQRLRATLVVVQVALAVALLANAGLLMRSLQSLSRVHPGFEAANVMSLQVARQSAPPIDGTAAATGDPGSARLIAERIAGLPGVESVSLASDIPLGGSSSAISYTADSQGNVTAADAPRAYQHRVTPEFFRTLRMPLLRGRVFTTGEPSGVAIVSESMVRRFWPDTDPIGRRIRRGDPQSTQPWWTIVGVVSDVKYRSLPTNPTPDPDIYLPFTDPAEAFGLLVRTSSDAGVLLPSLRAAIREVEPTATLSDISLLSERVASQSAVARFTGWLSGAFSVVALMLAALGIYGVIAYSAARRTPELGVRAVLGAKRSDLLRLVMSQGLALIAVGVVLGLAGARASGAWIEGLLFGIGPSDPMTYALVLIVLTLVGLAATLLPAWRASRVDPLVAIRTE